MGLLLILIIIVSLSWNVLESRETEEYTGNNASFADYWFQGKAEITRYKLAQMRYGEVHDGNAVLIFVTEDFLPEEQIKYEYGNTPDDLVKVLKLNFTRKFYTGIYPYSMMTSIFSPVNRNAKSTLKVTSTVQEWCGHTFMQLNLRENKYKGQLHSYFQNEGDREFELDKVLLEDEIWTNIRLNPQMLKTGDIKIIPGLQYQRLLHTPPMVVGARAELESISDISQYQKPLKIYRISYNDLPRQLEIKFESQFPHQIISWEEKYITGSGAANELTTRAIRTHSIMLDYWNKNNVENKKLLKDLGLN
jgi:hypothetical protein